MAEYLRRVLPVGLTQTLIGAAGSSLVSLLEADRDHAVLRELIGSQVRQRSAEVGQVIVGRALARGERVRATSPETVLDVTFPHLLVATPFEGATPGPGVQERLVDDVLLPSLHEQP